MFALRCASTTGRGWVAVAASAGVVAGSLLVGAGSASASAAGFSPGGSGGGGESTAFLARGVARPEGFTRGDAPWRVARAIVGERRQVLGLGDADGLTVQGVAPSAAGGHVVRLQQTVAGVPVMGGEVVVDLDHRNNARVVSSESLPGRAPSTTSAVSSGDAAATAVAATAKASGAAPVSLRAAAPRLWIYDPRVYGAPGLPVGSLVWRTEVTSSADPSVRQLVLVHAQSGAVVLSLNLVDEARNRRVCDAAGVVSAQIPCTNPVRTEGGPAVGVNDVNKAYDYAGNTYDFYKNSFGRDSLDGHGLTLSSTVRACIPGSACPWQNAQWNGNQMLYGTGYANADDVVGHELTHGVTQYSSNLFYYYQSGAINESLSDIFGEYVDLTNGKGNDSAAVRWKMGEDIPGGAIRDMKNPGLFGDPDRTGSGNWYGGNQDRGGVHTNSGVGNKFAFLITDGGTFNGRTVRGLGIPKASRVIYRASQLLTSGSSYQGLANALRASCTGLVGTAGITANDCTQVGLAVQATQMDTTPVNAPVPQAPVCPTGTTATTLWSDGFENPAAGQWWRNSVARPDGVYKFLYPSEGGVRYATTGTGNLWAPSLDITGNLYMVRNAAWVIPSGAVYLRFNHHYEFEHDAFDNYDGAILEYTVNNGTTWVDAKPLMVNGGYNGTIATGFGNPLAGRSAFVGESRGYTSTRLNMASLAGKNVRFRFREATDGGVGWFGWFIDDLRLYRCA